MDLDLLYRKTIEVTKLVASPPEQQLAQFPIQTCRPDEVALTFDEIIMSVDNLVKSEMITKDIGNALKALNQFYDTFNKGKDSDWTENAMFTSDKWKQTREMAKDILAKLGISDIEPNLFWIEYIYPD